MAVLSKRARSWLGRSSRRFLWGGVLVAALVGCAFSPVVAGSLGRIFTAIASRPDVLGWNLLYCALLGIIEETVLCGAVLPFLLRVVKRVPKKGALAKVARASSETQRFCAVAIGAGLFGLAHIGTGIQMGFGVPGVLLKMVQAFLFGVCMLALSLAGGRLWQPILTHAVFDFMYLGIPNIVVGISPLEAGVGAPESMLAVGAATVMLLITASYARRLLLRPGMFSPSDIPSRAWGAWVRVRDVDKGKRRAKIDPCAIQEESVGRKE